MSTEPGQLQSDLETRVQAVAARAIAGEPVILQEQDKRSLSLWAVKTVLLLNLALSHTRDGMDLIPPGHMRWLFDYRVAPPGTRIWIAEVKAGDFLHAWHYLAPIVERPPRQHGYHAAFSVGSLLFQILGPNLDRPGITLTRNPVLDDFFSPLWPLTGRALSWPPRRSLGIGDLELVWKQEG